MVYAQRRGYERNGGQRSRHGGEQALYDEAAHPGGQRRRAAARCGLAVFSVQATGGLPRGGGPIACPRLDSGGANIRNRGRRRHWQNHTVVSYHCRAKQRHRLYP